DPEKDYQPGYAAYFVGRFLATDAAAAYRQFLNNKVAREPWKVHAARLEEALKFMQATHGPDPVLKGVAPIALEMARNVEPGRTRGDTARGTGNRIPQFQAASRRGQAALYKSDPKAAVPLPSTTGEMP